MPSVGKLMEIIIGWAFLAAIVGFMASTWNRSGFGYFLLSLVVTPVIGLVILLLAGRRKEGPTPETHVRCPDCKELVHKEARKCKHCGCQLVPQ
jgi:uncharacterized membrane protein YeaQ/YmgE (transglycosylase-associated protein family)